MAILDYVELPVEQTGPVSAFYHEVFGWHFTEYGPDYTAWEEGPCQVGLNGVASAEGRRPSAILPILRVEDIEAARSAVVKAGGTVTVDIFDFPGGRRFHFSDPAGLELGCYEPVGS